MPLAGETSRELPAGARVRRCNLDTLDESSVWDLGQVRETAGPVNHTSIVALITSVPDTEMEPRGSLRILKFATDIGRIRMSS